MWKTHLYDRQHTTKQWMSENEMNIHWIWFRCWNVALLSYSQLLIWFYWESDRERYDSMHIHSISRFNVFVCVWMYVCQHELEQNASNRWEWDSSVFTKQKWSYARSDRPHITHIECWCYFHEQYTAIIIIYINTHTHPHMLLLSSLKYTFHSLSNIYASVLWCEI